MALTLGSTFSAVTVPGDDLDTYTTGYTKIGNYHYISIAGQDTTGNDWDGLLKRSTTLTFPSSNYLVIRDGQVILSDLNTDGTDLFAARSRITGTNRSVEISKYDVSGVNPTRESSAAPVLFGDVQRTTTGSAIVYNSDSATLDIVVLSTGFNSLFFYQQNATTLSTNVRLIETTGSGSSLPIRAAVYDATNNRYYIAKSGTATNAAGVIEAWDYNNTSHTITRNSAEDLTTTAAMGRLEGLYLDGDDLHILHYGSSGLGITVASSSVAPTISTLTAQTVNEGAAINIDISGSVTGDPTSYSLGTVSPSTPTITSLAISNAGVITGTAPAVSANTTFTIPVTATNAEGSDTENLSLTVNNIPAPTIATLSAERVNEGSSINIDISSSVTGIVTSYTLGTVSPTSPTITGLAISNAGVITGTAPQVSADTTFTIPVTATNISGSDTENLSLTITNVVAPTIAPLTTQTVTEGSAINIDISSSVTGGPTSYTLNSVTPNTPAFTGLQISNSGVITGTAPIVASNTTFTLSITATNAIGSDTGNLSIIVTNVATPTFSPFTLTADVDESAALNFNIAPFATGDNITYSVASTAPFVNLAITTNGVITGTAPAVNANTVYVITVTLTNIGGSVSQDLNVNVLNVAPPEISTFDQQTVNEGAPINIDISSFVTGRVTGYTLGTITPSTPTLTLAISDAGIITGTAPTVAVDTTYTITVNATNSLGTTSEDLTLIVRNAVTPVLAVFPAQTVNEESSFSIDLGRYVTGIVDSYAVGTVSPASPAIVGLAISSTGRLTGTAPVVSATSTYTIPITATNAAGSASRDLTLTVIHIPSITHFTLDTTVTFTETLALSKAVVKGSYLYALGLTGGTYQVVRYDYDGTNTPTNRTVVLNLGSSYFYQGLDVEGDRIYVSRNWRPDRPGALARFSISTYTLSGTAFRAPISNRNYLLGTNLSRDGDIRDVSRLTDETPGTFLIYNRLNSYLAGGGGTTPRSVRTWQGISNAYDEIANYIYVLDADDHELVATTVDELNNSTGTLAPEQNIDLAVATGYKSVAYESDNLYVLRDTGSGYALLKFERSGPHFNAITPIVISENRDFSLDISDSVLNTTTGYSVGTVHPATPPFTDLTISSAGVITGTAPQVPTNTDFVIPITATNTTGSQTQNLTVTVANFTVFVQRDDKTFTDTGYRDGFLTEDYLYALDVPPGSDQRAARSVVRYDLDASKDIDVSTKTTILNLPQIIPGQGFRINRNIYEDGLAIFNSKIYIIRSTPATAGLRSYNISLYSLAGTPTRNEFRTYTGGFRNSIAIYDSSTSDTLLSVFDSPVPEVEGSVIGVSDRYNEFVFSRGGRFAELVTRGRNGFTFNFTESTGFTDVTFDPDDSTQKLYILDRESATIYWVRVFRYRRSTVTRPEGAPMDGSQDVTVFNQIDRLANEDFLLPTPINASYSHITYADDYLFIYSTANSGEATNNVLFKVYEKTQLPPSIVPLAAQSVEEASPISINIADSVFGSVASYALGTVTPTNPVITDLAISAIGVITGTAPLVTADTTYTIPITVTNATGSDTANLSLTVENIPPPVISVPPLTRYENSAGGASLRQYTTGRVDSYTVNVSGITPTTPALIGVQINSLNNLVLLTPFVDEDTTYIIPVTATNISGTATANISLTVVDIDPPTIAAIDPVTVDEGAAISVDITGLSSGVVTSHRLGDVSPISPEIDDLYLAEGFITGTAPSVTQDTVFTIPIIARNSVGSATTNLLLTVRNVVAPTIGVIAPMTVFEGGTISIDISSVVTGSPTSYRLGNIIPSTPVIAGLAISNEGVITGRAPLVDADLAYTIPIIASNVTGTDTRNMSLTVTNITDPPSIGPITPQSVSEGFRFSLDMSVFTTGQGVIYTLGTVSPSSPSISSLAISANEGVLTGLAPRVNTDTDFTIPIIATNLIRSVSANLTLTVVNIEVPVLGTITPQTVNEGEAISISISPFVTGLISSYTLGTVSPSSPTISGLAISDTGRITGTAPSVNSDTTFTIPITIRNAAGSDSGNLTLTVNNVPMLPVITFAEDQTVEEQTSINIDISSSVTNSPTSYALGTVAPASPAFTSLAISNAGVITGASPDVASDTTFTIPVTATNVDGSDTEDLTLIVTAVEAPVIAAITPVTARENSSVSINISPFVTGRVDSYAVGTISPTSPAITNAAITDDGLFTALMPAVTGDTDYTIPITATNVTGSDTENLVLTVQDLIIPVVNIPPRTMTDRQVLIGLDLRPFVTGPVDRFSLGTVTPRGLTYNELTLTSNGRLTFSPSTRISDTDDVVVTIPIRATNLLGTGTGNLVITVIKTGVIKVRTIPNQTVNERTAFSINVSSYFLGDEVLSYSLAPVSPLTPVIQDLWINNRGVITGVAPAVPSNTIFSLIVIARDNDDSVRSSFQLLVRNIDAPIINTIDEQEVKELTPISINVSPFVEGDPSSYTLGTVSPTTPVITGLAITDAGVISGTAPLVSSDTTYTIPITATNSYGSDTENLTLIIRDLEAPVIAALTTQIVNENSALSIDMSRFTTGEDITYTLGIVTPSSPVITDLDISDEGVITGTTPDISTDTTLTIPVTATNSGGTDTENLVLTIRNVTPPTLSALSDVITYETRNLDINISSHATGENLRYGLATRVISGDGPVLGGRNEIRINAEGVIVGIVADHRNDTVYALTVTVRNEGGSAQQTFNLTVRHLEPAEWSEYDRDINNRYILFAEGKALSIEMSRYFTGSELTYSLGLVRPREMFPDLRIDPTTGLLTGTTPFVDDNIEFSIPVTATNQRSRRSTSLRITVMNSTVLRINPIPDQYVVESQPISIDLKPYFVESIIREYITAYGIRVIEPTTPTFTNLAVDRNGIITGTAPTLAGNSATSMVFRLRASGATRSERGQGGAGREFNLIVLNRYQPDIRLNRLQDQNIDEASHFSIDVGAITGGYPSSYNFGTVSPAAPAFTNLNITSAGILTGTTPTVAADTDFVIPITTTNAVGSDTENIPIKVLDVDPPVAPTFGDIVLQENLSFASAIHVLVTGRVDSYSLGAVTPNTPTFPELSITNSGILVGETPEVTDNTIFTIPITATNPGGSVTNDLTFTVLNVLPTEQPLFGFRCNRFNLPENTSGTYNLRRANAIDSRLTSFRLGALYPDTPEWPELRIDDAGILTYYTPIVQRDTNFSVPVTAFTDEGDAVTTTLPIVVNQIPKVPIVEDFGTRLIYEQRNFSIDISDYIRDAERVVLGTVTPFTPTFTAITINSDLVITGTAPSVITDTNFDVIVLAINGANIVTKVLTLLVKDVDTPTTRPALITIPDETVLETHKFNFNLNAFGINDPTEFTIGSASPESPAFDYLEISNAGTITGQAPIVEVDTVFTIPVTVSNNLGSATANFNLNVENVLPPNFTEIPTFESLEHQVFTIDLKRYITNRVTSYEISNAIQNSEGPLRINYDWVNRLIINNEDGLLMAPRYSELGTSINTDIDMTFNLIVGNEGGRTLRPFNIVIKAAPRPVIADLPTLNIFEDQRFYFNFANYVTGDVESYGFARVTIHGSSHIFPETPRFRELEIDEQTGLLSGIAPDLVNLIARQRVNRLNPLSYSIGLFAANEAGSPSATLTVVIQRIRIPVIDEIAIHSVIEGEQFGFDVSPYIKDPDDFDVVIDSFTLDTITSSRPASPDLETVEIFDNGFITGYAPYVPGVTEYTIGFTSINEAGEAEGILVLRVHPLPKPASIVEPVRKSIQMFTDPDRPVQINEEFDLIVNFSNNVTGFDTNDIALENAIKDDFTGSNSSYNLKVTADVSIEDKIVFRIARNSIDSAVDTSWLSVSNTGTISGTAPLVAADQHFVVYLEAENSNGISFTYLNLTVSATNVTTTLRTSTPRVVEATDTPIWQYIPNQSIATNVPFSIDVSSYITGATTITGTIEINPEALLMTSSVSSNFTFETIKYDPIDVSTTITGGGFSGGIYSRAKNIIVTSDELWVGIFGFVEKLRHDGTHIESIPNNSYRNTVLPSVAGGTAFDRGIIGNLPPIDESRATTRRFGRPNQRLDAVRSALALQAGNRENSIELIGQHFIFTIDPELFWPMQIPRNSYNKAWIYIPETTVEGAVMFSGDAPHEGDKAIRDMTINSYGLFSLYSERVQRASDTNFPTVDFGSENYFVHVRNYDGKTIENVIPPELEDFSILRDTPYGIPEAYPLIASSDDNLFIVRNRGTTNIDVFNRKTLEDGQIEYVLDESKAISYIPLLGSNVPNYFITGLDWFDGFLWFLNGFESRIYKVKFFKDFGQIRPRFYPVTEITISNENIINLEDYLLDSEKVGYDIGFDKPNWLSITNNQLRIEQSLLPTSTESTTLKLISPGTLAPHNTREVLLRVQDRDLAPTFFDIPPLLLEEGETIDLGQYTANFTSIDFKTGFVVPTGLSITNNILKVDRNAVTTDTTYMIQITATNSHSNLSTDTTFTLNLINTTLDIKNGSYQNNQLVFQVSIGGINVTSDLTEQGIDNIQYSIDVIDVSDFEVSECTLTLDDPTGYYKLEEDGFFEQNNFDPQTVEVIIRGGYEIDGSTTTRRLFTGTIIEITQNVDDGVTTYVCSDDTQNIRQNELIDFGIKKENILLDEKVESIGGTYTIPPILTPISTLSLSGFSGAEPLNVLKNQNLGVTGVLNPLNVLSTETEMFTEGELLPIDPYVGFKAPYRYLNLRDIINNVLEHYNLLSSDIELIENLRTEYHYSTLGKIGYNISPTDAYDYPKDFILDEANNKLYILVGSHDIRVNDRLLEYDIVNDITKEIKIFNADLEVWQLVSADFDTFYILATASRDSKFNIPSGTYDSAEGSDPFPSLVRILEYVHSEQKLEVFIDGQNNFRPTLATWYNFGAPQINLPEFRQQLLPDTRSRMFIRDDKLYYRFANPTTFGIARVDLSGLLRGHTSFYFNKPTDNDYNDKGFTFLIKDSNIFVAYCQNTEIYIDKNDFTNTTFTNVTRITNSDPTEEVGISVLELLATDTDLYFVSQHCKSTNVIRNIERLRLREHIPVVVSVSSDSAGVGGALPSTIPFPIYIRGTYRANEFYNASAKLQRVAIDGETDPEVLKEYDYVQTAARSLTIYNNQVHFFEGSHYVYKIPPQDYVSVDTLDPNVGRLLFLDEDDIPVRPPVTVFDKVGHVWKINGSTIEDAGVSWRSEFTDPEDETNDLYGIHGGMASPMIAANNNLYMVTGFGNYDETIEQNALIRRPNNLQFVVYSDKIQQRIFELQTNNKTGYDVLRELAVLTDSILGFNNYRFFFKPRQTYIAKFSRFTSTDLETTDPNRGFPGSGYLLIGNELLSYDGRTGNTFNNVERGLFRTTRAATYDSDTEVKYVNHVISDEMAFNANLNMAIKDDSTKLFNWIFVSYEEESLYDTRDMDSIDRYGEKFYTLDVNLTRFQPKWAESLGEGFLETFKDLQQLITVTMDLSLFIDIGEMIYFFFKDRANLATLAQVYEIEHDMNEQTTTLVLRTLS